MLSPKPSSSTNLLRFVSMNALSLYGSVQLREWPFQQKEMIFYRLEIDLLYSGQVTVFSLSLPGSWSSDSRRAHSPSGISVGNVPHGDAHRRPRRRSYPPSFIGSHKAHHFSPGSLRAWGGSFLYLSTSRHSYSKSIAICKERFFFPEFHECYRFYQWSFRLTSIFKY